MEEETDADVVDVEVKVKVKVEKAYTTKIIENQGEAGIEIAINSERNNNFLIL